MTAHLLRGKGPRRAPSAPNPWAGRVVLMFAAAALGAYVQLGACSRHADIRDEPDGSTLQPQPQVEAGDIPELDSGLETDAYLACAERPEGDCHGSVDFPCAFQEWATRTAETCQVATGCKTDGSLEVRMGADGCVVSIGMDEPNDEIVACLLAELGSVRCPCNQEEVVTYLFGFGHTGDCGDGGPPG
jgi:hypothetical protein